MVDILQKNWEHASNMHNKMHIDQILPYIYPIYGFANDKTKSCDASHMHAD